MVQEFFLVKNHGMVTHVVFEAMDGESVLTANEDTFLIKLGSSTETLISSLTKSNIFDFEVFFKIENLLELILLRFKILLFRNPLFVTFNRRCLVWSLTRSVWRSYFFTIVAHGHVDLSRTLAT